MTNSNRETCKNSVILVSQLLETLQVLLIYKFRDEHACRHQSANFRKILFQLHIIRNSNNCFKYSIKKYRLWNGFWRETPQWAWIQARVEKRDGLSENLSYLKTHISIISSPLILAFFFFFSLQTLFKTLAITFSCMAVFSGTPLYGPSLLYAGPASLIWGWLVVSFFTWFVGLALAEICSSFPVRIFYVIFFIALYHKKLKLINYGANCALYHA